MQINALASGTNKIIAELRAKHGGDKPIKLEDIATEDRELIGKAVGGKSLFTVNEIAAGLVDAFQAINKEDRRGWFRRGKGDGVVQPEELSKATARNIAASPLYTRIAQRMENAESVKTEIGEARDAQWEAKNYAMTGPDYVKVLAGAFAPYKDMSPRKAYESAMARYAATGNDDAAAKLQDTWQPLERALRELNAAATAYTHEEKNERMQKLRDGIREAKDRNASFFAPRNRTGGEHAVGLLYQAKIANAEEVLKETLSRPSIPASERDANTAKAQDTIDKLAGEMKFIIEDYGIALLDFRPEVMEASALAKHRGEIDARVKALQAELAKNAI